MTVGRKLVSLLLLCTALGYPAMACLTAAEADMTAAERECCRQMAHDCGSMGMPASHSCCRTEVRQAQSVLLAASAHFAPPAAGGALTLELPNLERADGGIAFSKLHAPPESPPGSSSILRI